MLRLERGELLLLEPCEEAKREADAAFRQAIEIATDQDAKTFELRASLARAQLAAADGERRKAFDTLYPVYSWFAQEAPTPDLIEARTLLEELR
jgi:hypothetical protein